MEFLIKAQFHSILQLDGAEENVLIPATISSVDTEIQENFKSNDAFKNDLKMKSIFEEQLDVLKNFIFYKTFCIRFELTSSVMVGTLMYNCLLLIIINFLFHLKIFVAFFYALLKSHSKKEVFLLYDI